MSIVHKAHRKTTVYVSVPKSMSIVETYGSICSYTSILIFCGFNFFLKIPSNTDIGCTNYLMYVTYLHRTTLHQLTCKLKTWQYN